MESEEEQEVHKWKTCVQLADKVRVQWKGQQLGKPRLNAKMVNKKMCDDIRG